MKFVQLDKIHSIISQQTIKSMLEAYIIYATRVTLTELANGVVGQGIVLNEFECIECEGILLNVNNGN
jgi:hypothetical protein